MELGGIGARRQARMVSYEAITQLRSELPYLYVYMTTSDIDVEASTAMTRPSGQQEGSEPSGKSKR